MATIGGAGHVWGALLGAGVVTILKDALQRILPATLGSDVQAETIVFGIVLVATLHVARDGLWPRLAALFRRLPRLPRRPMRSRWFAAAGRPTFLRSSKSRA